MKKKKAGLLLNKMKKFFELGKYRGFIYINSNILKRASWSLVLFFCLLIIYFRYSHYRNLTTGEFIYIHFLLHNEIGYLIQSSLINACITLTIWVLFPWITILTSEKYRNRNLYIIKNRDSLNKSFLTLISYTILLWAIIYYISIDIFSYLSYLGIDFPITFILSALFGVLASACSIYSALPQREPIFNRKIIPNLVVFPNIFPLKQNAIYLNVGALSPKLTVVLETLQSWNNYVDKYSPTSSIISAVITGKKHKKKDLVSKITRNTWEGSEYLREKIAEYVGLRNKENIVFLTNTSRGLEIALESLKPTYIVTSDHEHESQKQFFSIMKRRHKTRILEVPVVDSCSINPSFSVNRNFEDRFIEECNIDFSGLNKDETITVFLSHVCSSTGWILPVEKICYKLKSKFGDNISIIIDGAHSVGNIDVDISKINCDYYVFSGHKWLYGSPSLGILVINKILKANPDIATLIHDEVHEYLALSPSFPMMIQTPKNKFLGKCRSTICLDPLISLTITLDEFHNYYNKKYLISNMNELKKYFINELNKIEEYEAISDVPLKSSPGIFNIKYKYIKSIRDNSVDPLEQDFDILSELKEILEDNGIIVKLVYSPFLGNCIRVCIPFYLGIEDIDHVVKVLKKHRNIHRNRR